MEIIQITKEQFDEFANTCPYKNFYQTNMIAEMFIK